jgi:hypothetical protein
LKTVIYIALEFPPQNNTGSYRSAKFVKYLPYYGVTPIVLTLTGNDSSSIFGQRFDHSLLHELEDIEIIRVPINNSHLSKSKSKLCGHVAMFFSIHDKIVNKWEKQALVEMRKIIIEKKPSAVIITFPPFSCARLVKCIKDDFKLPVIVDFRDGWSIWGNGVFPSVFHHKLIELAERKILKLADVVVTVTEELRDKFLSVHGKRYADKFKVITNGFDFDLGNEQSSVTRNVKNEIIRIGYIGSYYYYPDLERHAKMKWYNRSFHRILYYSKKEEDWKYRSPYYFLLAMKKLIMDFPEYKSLIMFEHIGVLPDWLPQMLNELGLENNFLAHGFKPYLEVKQIASELNFLLATSEKNLKGPHYCLPSKIFDYLEINKPVLAFVTEGSQKEFFRKAGNGIIFNPDNVEQNVLGLIRIFNSPINLKLNHGFLSNYHRSKITGQLAELI